MRASKSISCSPKTRASMGACITRTPEESIPAKITSLSSMVIAAKELLRLRCPTRTAARRPSLSVVSPKLPSSRGLPANLRPPKSCVSCIDSGFFTTGTNDRWHERFRDFAKWKAIYANIAWQTLPVFLQWTFHRGFVIGPNWRSRKDKGKTFHQYHDSYPPHTTCYAVLLSAFLLLLQIYLFILPQSSTKDLRYGDLLLEKEMDRHRFGDCCVREATFYTGLQK